MPEKSQATRRLSYEHSTIRIERCPGDHGAYADNCLSCAPNWGKLAYAKGDPKRRRVKVELGPGVRVERFTDEELQAGAEDLRAEYQTNPMTAAEKYAVGLLARVYNTTHDEIKHSRTYADDLTLVECTLRIVMRAGARHEGERAASIGLRALRAALGAVGAY